MRDYLYISDAKVDMYLGQMDVKAKKQIAAHLGFNVGLLTAGADVEWVSSTDNRISRLTAVENEIRKVKTVGSPDSDAPWIEATVQVKAARFPDETDLLFFFSPGAEHFLALAGSAHHVLGAIRPATATSRVSHRHRLLKTLEEATTTYAFVAEKSDDALAAYLHAGVKQSGKVSSWTKILCEVAQACSDQPDQSITFLARRLISDEYGADGRRYTLASPLYLAEVA